MPFDPSTATPVDSGGGGFDPSTAKPDDGGSGGIVDKIQKIRDATDFTNILTPDMRSGEDGKLNDVASAAVRPIASGLAATPLLVGDATQGARNYLMGTNYEMPSKVFQDALNRYTSKPQGVGEIGEWINSGIVGAITGKWFNADGIGMLLEHPENVMNAFKDKAMNAVDDAQQIMRGGTGMVQGDALTPQTPPGFQITRNMVVKEAQQAGFKMVPEDPLGAGLAGASSKAKLENDISIHNTERVQDLSKLALEEGNAPLTWDSLDFIRNKWGQAYETVRNMLPHLDTNQDQGLMNDIITAGEDYTKVDRAFPNEHGIAEMPREGTVDASAIESLKGKYLQPRVSASEAVDAMRTLRQQAGVNLSSENVQHKALGMVQRQIADAYEAALIRSAKAKFGDSAIVQNMMKARMMISRAHTIQDAMNRSTGEISASAIARAYQSGAPINGELATIARAALAQPNAFKNVARAGREAMPFTTLDWFAILGGFHSNPSIMLAALLRPGIRKMLQSGLWQSAAHQATRGAISGAVAPGIAGAAAPMAQGAAQAFGPPDTLQ